MLLGTSESGISGGFTCGNRARTARPFCSKYSIISLTSWLSSAHVLQEKSANVCGYTYEGYVCTFSNWRAQPANVPRRILCATRYRVLQ